MDLAGAKERGVVGCGDVDMPSGEDLQWDAGGGAHVVGGERAADPGVGAGAV